MYTQEAFRYFNEKSNGGHVSYKHHCPLLTSTGTSTSTSHTGSSQPEPWGSYCMWTASRHNLLLMFASI